jgi:hypothetical protein
MKRQILKIKLPVPETANVYAEKGDLARNLLLYEVDELEVLEEVVVDTNKVRFEIKDGQFVNKGDVIFTEGILGHKAMVADFNGIIEITPTACRILGQKRHVEKRIELKGKVLRVVPKRFVEVVGSFMPISGCLFNNSKKKLTKLMYIEDKESLVELEKVNFAQTTLLVNDNLFVDDIAKLVALGVKRLIVNGVFINNLTAFNKEIQKLDGFCLISGFGELVGLQITLQKPKYDIFWAKNRVYISDDVYNTPARVFEHPFWGVSGEVSKNNNLVGNLDFNKESVEFYLKNLQRGK